MIRRILIFLLLSMSAVAQELVPVRPGMPEGDVLVARLRAGGLVMFLRHADSRRVACGGSFDVGDREGDRDI